MMFNNHWAALDSDTMQIYTNITEVNLSVLVYGLFRDDLSPLLRTIIDDLATIFIQISVGFLDGSVNPSLNHV